MTWWLLAALPHIFLSAWINYVRGGSKGWMRAPSWLPGRQLTGAVYFLPALIVVPWGSQEVWGGFLDIPTWAAALTLLYVAPSIMTIASQSPGHGSYMDMGYWDKADNEAIRLLLIPLKLALGTDRSFVYDFIGMLVKGVGMAAVPALFWGIYGGITAGVVASLGFLSMPIWYAVNHRWFPKLQTTKLFGAPVFWAELFHGAAIAAGIWAGVLLM